jgi:hypothetical protein
VTPRQTKLLRAAKQWYEANYCVVPSHEDGGKRPAGYWARFQKERPTWDQTQEWLESGQYTGIGVICGETSNNAEMIELEGPEDQAAHNLTKIRELAETKYAHIGLPEILNRVLEGCCEYSAGGGLHIFMHITDGPALGNTKLAHNDQDKVIAETRGEGGFVIVAPTPGRKGHKEGSVYQLAENRTPHKTAHITSEERDLLHMLIGEALHTPPTTTQQPPKPKTPRTTQELTPWDDWANHTSWADILTPHGWQYAWTAPDGRSHWVRPGKNIKDGTSASSLEDGPLYVFSTNTTLPANQGMSKIYVHAHYNHNDDMSAATKQLKNDGYGTDTTHPELPPWTPTPTENTEQAEDETQLRRDYVLTHLPAIDWHALWADETEEEWIVEPLLPARRLVALYSAPKVGKSLLMLELAAAIAAGRPILGTTPTPRRILYIDFENDPKADIRQRLTNMGYQPHDLENLTLLSFPTLASLDSEKGSQELMAACDVYGAEAVIIDTVSRSIEGDENENDTWLDFYRHTGLKLKQAQIALIRLDHSGKDETKGQRGGSAKSGDVDAVWRMSRASDDLFDLTCEANRLPIAERQLTIRRHEDPLRHEVVGDGYRAKRDELTQNLIEHHVPKDPELPVRDARKLARKMGVSFKDTAFTKALWEDYCSRPNPFTVVEIHGA